MKSAVKDLPNSEEMVNGINFDLEPEKTNEIIHKAWNKLWVTNDNLIIAFLGDTGTGKSWDSLYLGDNIDVTEDGFTIENNVTFTTLDFLEGIRDKRWGQGDVFVWEEAQRELNAKEAMTITNKAVGNIMSTYRRENVCAILNLPYIDRLEKELRQLVDAAVETTGIKYQAELGGATWYWLQFNQWNKKNYRHKIKLKHKNDTVKADQLWFPKPRKKLRENYEEIRDKYQDEVNDAEYERVKQKLENKEVNSNEERANISIEVADLILENEEYKQQSLRTYHKTEDTKALAVREGMIHKILMKEYEEGDEHRNLSNNQLNMVKDILTAEVDPYEVGD